VLDEAERRRGAVLFKHAVKIQSAARVLAAHDALCRRRKERELLLSLQHNLSLSASGLQAAWRRAKVRIQYIKMLGIARADSTHQLKNIGISKTQMSNPPSRLSASLFDGQKSWEIQPATKMIEGPLTEDETEPETEGETEGSRGDTEGNMTPRTDHSRMSSDTEPPSVASEDEAGMLDRLRAMGIGDQAVGHVMWVAGSSGGVMSADTHGPEITDLQSSAPTRDPPMVDGLVPLRAGRVHWAGLIIPTSLSMKKRKIDPIAEILKCKEKEVRRVLLWSRRQLHKEALARQLRFSIYEAEWMDLIWNPLSYRPSLSGL
jgi:hypothetical protein